MHDPRIITLLALIFMVPATPSLAAPFCVRTQELPPQCEFVDPVQCRHRAEELHGLCTANPAELVIRSGETEPYCLVLSSRTAECIYADRSSCEQDAAPAGGVCIEHSELNVPVNPYLHDVNRKY